MTDPAAIAPGGLVAALGVTDYEHPTEELAGARLPVSPTILQPAGIVHGGAYCALAETVASWATYDLVAPEQLAIGQSNNTTFLRSVTAGSIHAQARIRHRSRRTFVWDVEMSDDEGRPCALAIVTVVARPSRTSPAD